MSDEGPNPVSIEQDEDSESSDSNDDENDDVDIAVQSLVSGRTKRVTAGNRLLSLLEKEGDDDLELLFAEDEEEDVEFEGDDAEAASDVQLDSSSDDEDQGPAKADDDLEGERELQRQDRLEYLQKRKAQEVFKTPGGLRKKLKLDPTTAIGLPTTPAPRPRKKSERVSWIPTAEEGPTRSSTRKQTVQNKEIVHQRMIANEKRRVTLIGTMEAAAKLKEASKPKVMTQQERMEEAARTERKNAKSLNRWEETEKKRLEDQRAKMDALQNRQLSGPVITWWSGVARWVNGNLAQIGTRQIQELDKHEEPTVEGTSCIKMPGRLLGNKPGISRDQDAVMTQEIHAPLEAPELCSPVFSQRKRVDNPQQDRMVSPQGSGRLLDGIHYYASLPTNPQQPETPRQDHIGQEHDQMPWSSQVPDLIKPVTPVVPQIPPRQPLASLIQYSSKNLVVLENIDANATKIAELQSHILLKKRNGKIQSKLDRGRIYIFIGIIPDLLWTQSPAKSCARSRHSQPDSRIPRPVLLTSTRTRTRRFKGSKMADRGGVPFLDATWGRWPVLLEAFPNVFRRHTDDDDDEGGSGLRWRGFTKPLGHMAMKYLRHRSYTLHDEHKQNMRCFKLVAYNRKRVIGRAENS